jgi:hypothetical protein
MDAIEASFSDLGAKLEAVREERRARGEDWAVGEYDVAHNPAPVVSGP